MLSKKIKFTDFNGTEQERTFYFNLMKSELTMLEASVPGGFQGLLERITNSKDIPEIVEQFKKIILMSYGEKSADGMRFIKKDPVRGNLADEFEQSEAFSELFMELLTVDGAAAAFIEGIMPPDIMKQVQESGHAFPPAIQQS